jgi:hypothetical protein
MNDFFLRGPDGQPVGPYSVDALVRAVADGAVPHDAVVATRGGAWQPIASLADAVSRPDAPPFGTQAPTRTILTPHSPPSASYPAAGGPPAPPSPPLPPSPPMAPRTSAAPPPMSGVPRPPSIPPVSAHVPAATAQPHLAPQPLVPMALAQLATPAPPPAVREDPAAAAAKPAEVAAKPTPWPKWLPVAIFGAFFALALVRLLMGLARGGADEVTSDLKGAASGAPAPSAARPPQ